MKNFAIFLIAGIGAGGLGGALFGHFAAPASGTVRPQPAPSQARAVIVPPGWDLGLHQRVSAIEHRLDEARRDDEPGRSPAAPPAPSNREEERLAHYQTELEYRARSLADHDREPLDEAWSATESDQIKHDLAAQTKSGSAAVKSVDCRNKTCVATLSFPSAQNGLGFIQPGTGALTVQGCDGFSAIPQPPTGEGSYQLTVLYTCR
jgi:hypothetical protein